MKPSFRRYGRKSAGRPKKCCSGTNYSTRMRLRILYVKELIEGVRTNTEIRYVFVDEGQDSSFQYQYLKKLFPRARMTVLGDFGRAILCSLRVWPHPICRWSDFTAKPKQAMSPLYAVIVQPGKIEELTKSMLPAEKRLRRSIEVRPKPLLTRLDDGAKRDSRILADIAALIAEGFDSIAVITKTAAENQEGS